MSKDKHEPQHKTAHSDSQHRTEPTDTQRVTEHTTMGDGTAAATNLQAAVQDGPPILNLTALRGHGGELRTLAAEIRRHIPIHLLDAVDPYLLRLTAIGDSLDPALIPPK